MLARVNSSQLQMDPPLAKAGPISKAGDISVITYLRKSTKCWAAAERERSEKI